MYSLCRTLSVRFASTMLLGLLIVGTSLLFTARRVLRGELDRGLQAAVELETATLDAGRTLPHVHGWPTRDAFVANVNRFVVLRDTLGNVLAGNTTSAQSLPLDSTALGAAAAGERRWVSDKWGEDELRSLYAPGPNHTILQVAAVMQPIDGVFAVLFGIMLGTVVITTGVSGIGAWWLTRAASGPVGRITSQMNLIDDAESAGRITAHANAEEYHDLVVAINDMLRRLQRSAAAQRRIIENTGHDIRTPITAMQGELEVALRSERTPEQYRRTLASCLDEVRHLSNISDKLLLLARIETGAIALQPQVTDVPQMVLRNVAAFQTEGTQREFKLEQLSDGAASLVDESLVSIALREVLDNTIRHTPPGTVVTVGVTVVDQWVQVTIDDTGPGVPFDHLQFLFERTYREDAARTRGGGTGLGLAIVAAIVRIHQGALNATPSPGGGLRVILQLPSAPQRLGS